MNDARRRDLALRGRIGGLALSASRDPHEYTAAARCAFLARFEQQVDPDGILLPYERQRRALAARRAHFARLALKSAKVRRERAGRRDGGGK